MKVSNATTGATCLAHSGLFKIENKKEKAFPLGISDLEF